VISQNLCGREFEMTKRDLIKLTVTGLKALARKKKIVLTAGAKKADLIAALLKAPDAGKSANAAGTAQRKKATAKELSTKRTTARKATAKNKVAGKKITVSKKAAAAKTAKKKASTKKSAPKKAAAKKATTKKATTRKAVERTVPAKTSRRTWVVPKSVKVPLLTQEKVADAKYYTGPEVDHAVLRSSDKLPAGYGEDRITLMARDPSLTYAYWEATPERLVKERAWFGMEAALVVRIYDITGVQFDGRNAVGYFDQDVNERVGSWYFETGRPGHSFCADLGIRSPEGRFLTLTRSNYITMPRDGVSDVIDEEWMLADEEFWQLYGFPDGVSSPQVQELWRRRHQREISSPGLFSREKRKNK
jgi:uncharacterized protein